VKLRLLRGALIALGAIAVAEGVARFGLGLGDPPLMVADPQIEYLFRPNATYRRFGHRVHYNAYSMRSDDFPPHKSASDEVRILMIGDSVVNGGAQTDQSELATALVQGELAGVLHRRVTVGNVSAGSWGPPNMLAYIRRFGIFDADVVVLVLSTHDAIDLPTFAPIVGVDPDFPDRKPLLAIDELLFRYAPRCLGLHSPPTPAPSDEHAALRECLAAECGILQAARAAGAVAIVAQHLERSEIGRAEASYHRLIASEATRCGARAVQLGPAFERAIAAGEQPYRDNIHPNARGQRLMADVAEPAILAALASRGVTPH
jgi:lysophospholipase L1-like esterase